MKKIKIIVSVFIVGLFFVQAFKVYADVPTETVLIRNGDTVIYQGSVPLPASGTIDVLDNTGATHTIDADSVLGVFYAISQSTSSFTLSNIQYYSSFNSLYLKCLTPAGGGELCDNWQFVVGGTTPFTSMDTTILSGGETVGLYFGSSHQVILDKTSAYEGDSIKARAENYNYLDNTWGPLTGVTIGVTVPNESDPYNPTVVTSTPVDANGEYTFTLPTAGLYNVGISEDYYFPLYPITISTHPSGGGGGGGMYISPTKKSFDTTKAISYLESIQNTDGSFGADMYTDWVTIALSAGEIKDTVKNKILEYMTMHNTVSSLVTDSERHAMALMSLGENPYAFHGVNYIEPIVKSFDGAQFGDKNLVNDDIFAIIPLKNSGYKDSDEIITKDVAFIISKQNENGSWENSVDMTSAGIQALAPLQSVAGVKDAIDKAGKYLESKQENDGGFGSVPSASWVIQAMNTLGLSWVKNGNSILDYLANMQMTDGAVLPISETNTNRIWATSYAIPAIVGKSWNIIMKSFDKPVEKVKQVVEEKPKVEIKKQEIKINPKIGPVNKIKVSYKSTKENKKINTDQVVEQQSSLTASAATGSGPTTPPKTLMNRLDSVVNGFMAIVNWLF